MPRPKLPEGLREQIEAAAAASGRSLCQEVEFRLQQSFYVEDFKQVVREILGEATTSLRP